MIRFRTPITEPEEVGFIMLVIASAICAATFNFDFILYLCVFALLALVAPGAVVAVAEVVVVVGAGVVVAAVVVVVVWGSMEVAD